MKKKLLFIVAALLSICNAFAVVTWDGTTEAWTQGAGTQSNPYLIETPQQLAYLLDLVHGGVSNYQGVYFKQTEDFDMNGKTWSARGTETNYFSGVYDGSNKIIQNIILKGVSNVPYVGLFGYTNNATIQNIRLKIKKYQSLNYDYYVGGICGYMVNGTIQNCEVNAHSDSIGVYWACTSFGGIVGYMESATMDKCTNNVIYGCGSYYGGGLVGTASGTKTAKAYITNSYNTKRISNAATYLASTDRPSNVCIGGAVGYVKGRLEMNNVHSSGVYSSTVVTNNAQGLQIKIGGLIGLAGGLNAGIILTLCSNSKDIYFSGHGYHTIIGGLVGESTGGGTITGCSHRGDIIYENGYIVAGLVAETGTSPKIYSSYCISYIKPIDESTNQNSGSYAIAGICTDGASIIKNSYFAGKLQRNSSYKYAIAPGSSISNCYYRTGNEGTGVSGATVKTAAEMKSASFPVILNQDGAATFYMDLGNVNYGYPVLEYDKVNTYTITWKNYDGTTLETDTEVPEGTTPTYNGKTPTKASTSQYTYTFKGWTPSISPVHADITYTATYTSTIRSYTVKFLNEDGSEISSNVYQYGQTPVAPANPTKEATAEYTYTFAGWDKTVTQVQGDQTYRATFNAIKNSYTIIWQNEDGSLIDQTAVEYGVVPTHADPVKQNTAEYTYTFAGWTPEVVAVTGNATYRATFNVTKNKYLIIFRNDDGTELKRDSIEYSVMPIAPANPTKVSTAQYDYSFNGWFPIIVEVTQNATYTATYTSTIRSYTVKFLNEDGNEISSNVYQYGQTPVAPAEPTKEATAEYTYTFADWTPAVVAVTGDATYRATFNAE